MAGYELTFLVDAMPDRVVDDLFDAYDCIVGTDHSGQDYVTLTAPGRSAVSAAKTAVTELNCLGLRVCRLRPDLVGRREIAERAACTRQAVGNWVRGDRYTDDAFPAAYSDAAGGVWLWGEVVRWLEAHGLYEPAVEYPTAPDLDLLNGWIAARGQDPGAVVANVDFGISTTVVGDTSTGWNRVVARWSPKARWETERL